MGDKTVAVDVFEGNNLLLIDEGCRAHSSTRLACRISRYRDRLTGRTAVYRPYARWCGRGDIARCPPIPLRIHTPF